MGLMSCDGIEIQRVHGQKLPRQAEGELCKPEAGQVGRMEKAHESV